MDILEIMNRLPAGMDAPIEVDVLEVRIATTVAATCLAMFALRRSIQHKRQRQFDLTAAYLATFLALSTFVLASSLLAWDRLGVGISSIREMIFLVYNLLTMLGWALWFIMGTRRGINDDRPEGR